MPSSHSPAKLTRPPAPTPRIVELVVVRGRDLGLSFLLEGTEMVLGRSSGVELRIDDPDVSRRHARLCRTGPIWRVEDLGSRNGTFVNGERVEGTRALRLGDRLRLGTQLELAVAEDEPARGELLQRQRLMAVGRLSLGIAHDFNNMLATLAASIDYLRQAGPGDPQGQADCLFDMQVAVERATELASRLLHAGKGSSGRLRTVDGSQLLAEAAMLLRRSIPRHIRIETDVAPRIHLRGDSVALHQVVMNLLMNARDALPPSGGVIVLAARTDGSEVHVEVRDNGSGMSPETSARIFEPFFTTKQDGVGFGLGLATTKAIVERHGGT
ncbi:MAG: FHA domain-containing protein, partial [Myxococcales bacterium]|nr:FHA domain-containing protein [Myxococcales bacterium]